jgi:hypothetical protein
MTAGSTLPCMTAAQMPDSPWDVDSRHYASMSFDHRVTLYTTVVDHLEEMVASNFGSARDWAASCSTSIAEETSILYLSRVLSSHRFEDQAPFLLPRPVAQHATDLGIDVGALPDDIAAMKRVMQIRLSIPEQVGDHLAILIGLRRPSLCAGSNRRPGMFGAMFELRFAPRHTGWEMVERQIRWVT